MLHLPMLRNLSIVRPNEDYLGGSDERGVNERGNGTVIRDPRGGFPRGRRLQESRRPFAAERKTGSDSSGAV